MPLIISIGTNLPEIIDAIRFFDDSLPDDSQNNCCFLPETLTTEQFPPPKDPFFREYSSFDSVALYAGEDQPHAFVIIDPTISFIEELEKLADVLRPQGVSPARIISFIDTHAAELSPTARTFFEATAWYSDVVLLGNRQEASKKFIRDFQKSFEEACYPSLFAFVKKNGRTDDPLAILFPEARRLSHLFDITDSSNSDEDNLPLPFIIEASCDLDDDTDDDVIDFDPFRQPSPSGHPPHQIPSPVEFLVPFS